MRSIILLLASCLLFTIHMEAQCPGEQILVEVIINQDNYPSETSWTLVDNESNLLMSGDAVGDEICIPSDLCMVFTINDSYGDGLCCGYGIGSFEIRINDVFITGGGEFDYSDTRSFNCAPGFTCDEAILVTDGTHTATDGNAWFRYVPEINGSYKLSTCDLGNTCDSKIWIYEYCNMGLFDESNAGTVYYDNDEGGCGEQAQLNVALLEGGVPYWIRIGDNLNDCDGQDIEWTLSYNGPIIGCTDPNACNYNPLAEESSGDCIFPGDPDCPDGPDLVIVESAISSSLQLTTIFAEDGNCYIPEGCLNGYGTRDIIRFSTHIKNIGNQDYYIGNPSDNPDQFDLENCHNHTHYKGYAEYLLFDLNGVATPIGFKNGFCVLDLECSDGGTAQYGCSNMGISAQCGDIYSSGLTCQWIDITDTPDGIYTMVVRTNWDQDPDALGRHELDYANNWGQVCIAIDRSTGTLTVNEVSDCDPYVDCAGEIYGDAQPDCSGQCGGTALSGDVDGNLVNELADVVDYAVGLADEDFTYWTCFDLDGDAEITVSDAAALVHCLTIEHDHGIDESHEEEECAFPVNMVTNIFDEVEFSISTIDLTGGYFEVSMRNPLTRVLAYEMIFEGVDITSAENLIDDGSYPISPEVGNNGSHVVGISMLDSSIVKHVDFTPILRLYFDVNDNPTSICLTEVVDIVNDMYENGVPVLVNACGTCTYDLDTDGDIDVDDFLVFNSSFGQQCECASDFDGDGFVGIADFLAFNSAYGSDCSTVIEGIEGSSDLIDFMQENPSLIIDPQLKRLINDLEVSHHMALFPNPNRGGQVSISLYYDQEVERPSKVNVSVFDLQGKMIQLEALPLNGSLVNLTLDSAIPAGSYFIEVDASGLKLREKLVVLK